MTKSDLFKFKDSRLIKDSYLNYKFELQILSLALNFQYLILGFN